MSVFYANEVLLNFSKLKGVKNEKIRLLVCDILDLPVGYKLCLCIDNVSIKKRERKGDIFLVDCKELH